MENLNDILASLTPEDIRSLKETAEAVFGSNDSSQGQHGEQSGNHMFNTDFGTLLNPEMISKITGVMSAMNSDGGKRCRLIEALKPNLSYNRQKKADEAVQILKLLDVLPLITNLTGKSD